MKGRNKNFEKGITLIALVITIIVLLILAGVSIATLTGDNGILTKAGDAKEETEKAEIIEELKVKILEKQEVSETGDITENDLETILETKGTLSDEKKILDRTLTTTDGSYDIKVSDIYDGTIVSKVKVEDIFDESGTKEGMLHIGDFINYTAGTWTDTDMDTIKETANVEPSTSLPSKKYQFGGFAVGESRDGNATPHDTSYAYVQDKTTGSAVTGWRLFDVSDDGVITLITAGCPENYYHPYGANNAYISEYILTGNKSSNADVSSLGLGSTYKSRDWSMYVNEKYKSTTATASALTKAKLDAWYSKYITKSNGANTWTDATFQLIYGTRYESLIDNYSYYWLSSANGSSRVYIVNPDSKYVSSSGDYALGVRVLVSLPSDVKLSDEATGTKTIVSRNNEYIYNVWNLE